MESIAFLGIGLMGTPMAHRLLAGRFPLSVWNRTSSKARSLVGAGAKWGETPAAAVAGANVVITMLTDAKAVASVLFESGAAGAMQHQAIVIDMTSTSPPVARDHAARFASRG